MAAIAVSLTFFVLLSSAPAQASERLALVIGNSDYVVQPLENPVRDAELMAGTLEDIGFDVTLQTNLTEREFLRAVISFGRDLRAAGDDAVGLFFYAGHAIQADGENYLIPVDATLEDKLDLEIQAVEASTVMRSLESAGNALNLIFLDACRNNPFKGVSRSGTRGLAKIDAPTGTLVAYSTAPGDVASDGSGRNSPYTKALAKAIREPGRPIELILKQVRIEVMERTGRNQVPWESSSLTGDFFFVPEAAAPAAAAEPEPAPAVPDQSVEIEYWKAIDAAGAEAGYQDYLGRYPDGLFAGLARSRLTAMEAQRRTNAESAARQAETDYFQSLQQAESTEGYESYLQRYPDGLFVSIAQGRLTALRQAETDRAAAAAQAAQEQQETAESQTAGTQTAALTPPSEEAPIPAEDGVYRGVFIGTGGGGWTFDICGDSARYQMEAHVADGRIVLTTQFGNDRKKVSSDLDAQGRFQMRTSIIKGRTSSVPFIFKGRFDGTQVVGTFFHLQASNCSAEYTLTAGG